MRKMKIARVFPRRTKATPADDMAFVGEPPLWPIEADEVHVSVAFTWDLPEAERLARSWQFVAPVRIGGPATGMRGEEFIPGRYLAPGYTITSRGCPNKCWFCSVWKRDGGIRELPISPGWNVLDDNLLACSEEHVGRVFAMLSVQNRSAEFTGGLEAARFTMDHAAMLYDLSPKTVFFAYDTQDDLEPLRRASELCWSAGIKPSSHVLRCYVLIGYPKDTFGMAEERLLAVLDLGIVPMAMLWRDSLGVRDPYWRTFQRAWARPASVMAMATERRQMAIK